MKRIGAVLALLMSGALSAGAHPAEEPHLQHILAALAEHDCTMTSDVESHAPPGPGYPREDVRDILSMLLKDDLAQGDRKRGRLGLFKEACA